jgi:CRISPR-associated protein Csb2
MQSYLRITVRFLNGAFHGRGDRGEPEWPPSPLRLFQALVAAAAAHWNERGHIQQAAPALCWLEAQPTPVIVAPLGVPGAKRRLYVPDNIGDLVAGRWSRGDDAAFIKRSEKDVRPIRMLDGDAVHYLWPLSDLPPDDALFAAVGSITHLGWGVDMVVAHAAILTAPEAAALPGQRWQPIAGGGDNPLRVPAAGTLADLEAKHAAFLNRTSGGHFSPVPPLFCYAVVNYADSAAPAQPPMAAFSLLQPDASGYRIFDPVRDAMRVAGMLRHAASQPHLMAALGWDEEKRRRTVLGHGEAPGGGAHMPVDGPRIAFLPLPSLEARPSGEAVGSIRRVLLAGVRSQSREELRDLALLLSGQRLIEEERQTNEEGTSQEANLLPDSALTEASSRIAALLSRLPDSDPQVRRYVDKAAVWTTVTPVILPGYDDRGKYRARLFLKEGVAWRASDPAKRREWLAKIDARIESLLRKAIRQAGFSEELTRHAELSWREAGFCRGSALASAYAIPSKLRRFRRLHVRIVWRDAAGNPLRITGPLCLGNGRFVGLGLFCGARRP